MIILTEKAINKIKEISDDEGIGHYSVRVKLLSGGCAGFSHDMEFDNSPLDTDEILNDEEYGIRVLIDEMSSQYLDDVVMDYVESAFGGGFKFSGGEIKSKCGCGSSIGF